MRRPHVRLRTVMTVIVFVALALAVTVQSVRLQQALAREQRLRVEAEFQEGAGRGGVPQGGVPAWTRCSPASPNGSLSCGPPRPCAVTGEL